MHALQHIIHTVFPSMICVPSQVEQLAPSQAKADITFRLTVTRECKLEGPAAPAWKLHTDSED